MTRTDNIREASEIEEDHEIYVMPQGKILVTKFANSFGFLHECVMSLKNQDTIPKFRERIIKVKNTQAIGIEISEYLKDAAQMHYDTLHTFRNSMYANSTDWLADYLCHFGVPKVNEYSASCQPSRRVNGMEKCFQLQLVFASVINYTRDYPIGGIFAEIKNAYDAAIDTLSQVNSEKIKIKDLIIENRGRS